MPVRCLLNFSRFPAHCGRFFPLLTLLVLLLHPATGWGQTFAHGTAGFSVKVPSQWTLQLSPTGMDLSSGTSLIGIHHLGITVGESETVLALFSAARGRSITRPFPGLRTTDTSSTGSAELVVLHTPGGFYLLSLEQPSTTTEAVAIFDALLTSFSLLPTAPFTSSSDLLLTAQLGPAILALPAGEIEQQTNYLIWKGAAGSRIIAEVMPMRAHTDLAQLLDTWVQTVLAGAAGFSATNSVLHLEVMDRSAWQADYGSQNSHTRVQITALDQRHALLLALITPLETFTPQQALLDAVSFSVMVAAPPPAAVGATPAKSEAGPAKSGRWQAQPTFDDAKKQLYADMLRSDVAATKRDGAKYVIRHYRTDQALLDLVEKELLAGFNQRTTDRHYVDAMAWLCRALGESGLRKYRATLEKVAKQATNDKIRRYARRGL